MLARFLAIFAAMLAVAPCAGAGFGPDPLFLTGEAFDSMHASAVTANLPGVSFMLRTIDGRTQFQCGERIQVQFVISSRLKNKYHCDPGEGRRDGWNKDVLVCDAVTRAVDPLTSNYLEDNSLLVGDRLDQFPNYVNSPRIDTMDLNEWIAFDKPGTYRVYAITRRVYALGPKGLPSQDIEKNGGPPTASTVLTLTITPTENAWEQRVITQALAPYHGPWDDVMEQRAALLRYLRTKDAAVTLLHEMESNYTYKYPQDKGWYEGECAECLLESPYRVDMIPLMEQEIADPDFPVTESFLGTYCVLLIYKAAPTKADDNASSHPSLEDISHHATSLLQQALPAKRGSAREVSSQTAKTFNFGINDIIAMEQGG